MKRKLFVILVAIFSVIPITLIMPEASSTILKYDTVTTNYGSYSYTITKSTEQIEFGFEQWGFSIPFPEGSTITFEYNFNKAYSGRFDLLITNNTSWIWNTCYVMVDGGYFEAPLPTKNTATTGKTFKIHVNNSDHIVVTFISSASTLFNANTTISVSANYLTDGVELSDIDSTLDLYLPGMSTSLTNIYNGIGYDSNTSTSLNADTLAYDISIIKNYIDGLEGYISTSNTYIDQVESYLNQLENLNKIQTFPIWQQNVLFWANSMGQLQFDQQMPYFYYNAGNNTGVAQNNKRIKIGKNGSTSLVFYTSVNNPQNAINIYGTQTSYVTMTALASPVVPTYPLYLFKLDFKNSYNSSNFISIEFTNSQYIYPVFLGETSMIPEEICELLGIEYNNTYTRLLQQISNGVNGVYDTSEYNQYEQVVDNLNDSLLIDVNNSKDNILTDISNQSGNSSDLHLNNVRTAINGLFNDIFTIIPPLKYLVVVGLIILVLGVIL